MALALVFVDADAALLRNGRSVDAVHIFRALQQSFDGRVANEVGLGVDERAAIDEMNGLDAAFAGLGEKGAETSCEIDVGRKLHVLFVAERGQIDGVLHDAELEIFAHLHRDLNADGLLRFGGGPGDVRREDDVLEFEIRRVFRAALRRRRQAQRLRPVRS